MAAFTAMDPKINEIVGSFGNYVAGVVVLAGGTATVDLSSKMSRVDGAVGTSSSSATALSISISGTTITVSCGAGTDVISYIAFGLTKR